MSEHRGTDSPDSDQETAAVIERAQRMIAERRLADAGYSASSQRPWQIICIILPLVLIVGTFFWPSGTLADRLRVIVRGICDQQHNLESYGMMLPLDARCTGIYTGVLLTLVGLGVWGRLGAASFPRRPVLVSGVLAILFVGVDGVNSVLAEAGGPRLYVPHNALRLASGLGSGVALALLGMPLFNGIIRAAAYRDQREVASPLQTLGTGAFAALLGVLLWFGGPAWLFPLLAVWSVLGEFVALALMHLFVLVILTGMQRRVVLVAQLAQPAVLSMCLVVLELFVLAVLRGAP